MERTANINAAARILRMLFIICAPVLLANCASSSDGFYTPAPGTYFTITAGRGDSVSEIAHRYRVSEDNIVAMNDLPNRHTLHAGQRVKVPAYGRLRETRTVAHARYVPERVARADTVKPEAESKPRPGEAKLAASWWPKLNFDTPDADAQFLWPVKGAIISSYGASANGERNDGINIAAREGAPIRAAAAGTVTYTGNELKGYGNLVLIRHDNGYVTAYAHADSILVARGDRVSQGQIIAYAGETGDVSKPQLHFEIRHGTRPVDPQPLLVASR